MKLRKLAPMMALTASLLLGMAAAANADHRNDPNAIVEAKAQFVYDVSGQSQQALFKQFYRSRNYGELLGKIAQIRGKSIHLRTLARINACPKQMTREARALDKKIHEFEALVDIARARSERGLDRPLIGCTLHMDRKNQAMVEATHCMIDALAGQVIVRQQPRVEVRQRPNTRDYYRQPAESYYRRPADNYYQRPGDRYYRGPVDNRSRSAPVRSSGSFCPYESNGIQIQLGSQGSGISFRFNR